jgi:hypothetical protein
MKVTISEEICCCRVRVLIITNKTKAIKNERTALILLRSEERILINACEKRKEQIPDITTVNIATTLNRSNFND